MKILAFELQVKCTCGVALLIQEDDVMWRVPALEFELRPYTECPACGNTIALPVEEVPAQLMPHE